MPGSWPVRLMTSSWLSGRTRRSTERPLQLSSVSRTTADRSWARFSTTGIPRCLLTARTTVPMVLTIRGTVPTVNHKRNSTNGANRRFLATRRVTREMRFPIWKRSCDLIVSSVALLFLSPLLLVTALLIKLDSRGPAFFRQERIGRRFETFSIYKLRTMVADASEKGGLLTSVRDPRITRLGRILRKHKIDELP